LPFCRTQKLRLIASGSTGRNRAAQGKSGQDAQALFHGVIDPVLGAFTEQAHRLLGVAGSGLGLGFGIWIQDQAALSG
jgi:hypothetical protein